MKSQTARHTLKHRLNHKRLNMIASCTDLKRFLARCCCHWKTVFVLPFSISHLLSFTKFVSTFSDNGYGNFCESTADYQHHDSKCGRRSYKLRMVTFQTHIRLFQIFWRPYLYVSRARKCRAGLRRLLQRKICIVWTAFTRFSNNRSDYFTPTTSIRQRSVISYSEIVHHMCKVKTHMEKRGVHYFLIRTSS